MSCIIHASLSLHDDDHVIEPMYCIQCKYGRASLIQDTCMNIDYIDYNVHAEVWAKVHGKINTLLPKFDWVHSKSYLR